MLTRRGRFGAGHVRARMFLAAPVLALAGPACAQPPPDPDKQAAALVKQMTPDERNLLLHGFFSRPNHVNKLPQIGAPSPPAIRPASRGWAFRNWPNPTPAWAWPGSTASGRKDATALPSSLALAATWDLKIAYAGSAAIAQDARASGLNVLLAGGVNLTREPRNGRNFEYLGEDPLLAGMLAGETIRAIQDQHVMSTVKHYALNAQETQQSAIGVDISEARGAGKRPAGLRDRHRARQSRRGDVRLQSFQRALRLRQRLPAQQGAEAGLGLSRLCDVGLGRQPCHRRRPGGAGPGIRRGVRRADLFRRARWRRWTARTPPIPPASPT